MIKNTKSKNKTILNLEENPDYTKLKVPGKILRDGGLVIFPTETVYGLGANGLNEKAVEKIYIAKGRKPDNPLILHINDIGMLGSIAKDISDIEFKLMNEFWPGPFTIILKKSEKIPTVVTGGLDTVAVRMPDNEIARNLIKYSGVPIAAPSANISGKPSGTNIQDIYKELLYKVDYFINGGNCQIGLESTVVKVIDGIPHILRPGKVTPEEIKKVAGNVIVENSVLEKNTETEKVLSPGMKYKHYAPNTKCILVYNDNKKMTKLTITELANNCISESKKPVIMCLTNSLDYFKNIYRGTIDFINMGNSNEEICKNLFANLRKVDEFNADLIIIEGVKAEGLGIAIMNRLLRACEYNLFK